MSTTYILLGSNLNHPSIQLKSAREAIAIQLGPIVKASSCYETAPWGFEHPNPFLNQVVVVNTALSPLDTLHRLLSIEQGLGRKRSTEPGYSARCIDLDILFIDDQVIDLAELVVPHPRLQERQFVLVPLAEIAPELQHPILHKSIGELQASLAPEPIEKVSADHVA